MGTYADYFNAQYNGPTSSGPVRLTIGRNAQGVEEELTWTEEELMDQAEDELETAVAATQPKPSPHKEPARHTAVPDALSRHNQLLPFPTPHSMVWVLDTNVLLSFLALLRPFFDVLWAAALHSYTPVYLVVPHCVLEELDSMKHSERRLDTGTAGAAARNASRWLLETVQRQKHNPAACNPARWVLHVPRLMQTNDQAIVALCSELSTRHAQVYFVSNDTNARTLAEIQGAATLDLKPISAQLSPTTSQTQRLFWVCACPEYHYLLHDPQHCTTLPDDAWMYMQTRAAQLLPDPDADVPMAGA